MTYEINFNGETVTVVREEDYIKLIYKDSFSKIYKESYDDNDLQILIDTKDEEKIAKGIAAANE